MKRTVVEIGAEERVEPAELRWLESKSTATALHT
jgi:hypothetical protein